MLAEIAWDKWYYVVGIAGGLLALWRPVIRPVLRTMRGLMAVAEMRPSMENLIRRLIPEHGKCIDERLNEIANDSREAKLDAKEAKLRCIAQDKVLDVILKLIQQKHGGT